MNDPMQDTNEDSKEPSKLQILEMTGLAVVMVVVTGLLTLPIIFIHLPVQLEEENVRIVINDK